MTTDLRAAVLELLALRNTKEHASPREQAAWAAVREALAVTVEHEFLGTGTGVTDVRELAAAIAADDSRICVQCGQMRRRERTGRNL